MQLTDAQRTVLAAMVLGVFTLSLRVSTQRKLMPRDYRWVNLASEVVKKRLLGILEPGVQ